MSVTKEIVILSLDDRSSIGKRDSLNRPFKFFW